MIFIRKNLLSFLNAQVQWQDVCPDRLLRSEITVVVHSVLDRIEMTRHVLIGESA